MLEDKLDLMGVRILAAALKILSTGAELAGAHNIWIAKVFKVECEFYQ